MSWNFGDIRVREARGIDALAVLAIHRAVLEEGDFFITRADEFGGSVDERAEQVSRLAEADNSVFLVAKRGREVVGFLTLQGGTLARMRHVAKLEIMVAPSARGAGVGKALMEAAVGWAEHHEVVEKIGLAVFATNARAIALYRTFGFQEEGRRVQEYRMEDGRYRDDLLLYRMTP